MGRRPALKGTGTIRWLGALIGSATLLAACGSSGGSSGTASSGSGTINTNGTITEGYTLPPTTLDPEVGTSGADYVYLAQIYGNLIEVNSAGTLIPAMASSWAFSGTGAKANDTFTITLRHGLKFSDGTPLNAAAVVSDWKRYLASGDIVDDMEYVIPSSIHAIGQYQVQEQTSQPNAQLPWGLADRAGMIIDPTAFKKEGAANFGTHPVGAGPYKVTSVSAGHSYCYTRNDTYYLSNKQDPRIKNLCIQDYANTTTEDTALRSGTVQVGIYLQGNDYKVLKPDSQLKVLHGPSLGFDQIYFNGQSKASKHGPNLVSPKLRLAFNLGLNRQRMNQIGEDGLGTVSTEVRPPGSFGYVAKYDTQLQYNPAKATALMKSLGYSPSHPYHLTCDWYPGLGYNLTDPVMIASEKAIGIDMNVVEGPTTDVVSYYTENSYPCYVSGWGGGANPVTTYEGVLWSHSYYNAHFCTTTTSCGSGLDWGDDPFINKFFTTFSTSAENDLFTQIDQNQTTNPGNAVVYFNPTITAFATNVAGPGVTVNPNQSFELDSLYYK
ncbi:MAG TPA: ABC transporter substrate-binding protein [Streptosporangiaceae bacterium]|nr:ABC transporter substrate-binding protein [Streptosporangiaceae bacterium]